MLKYIFDITYIKRQKFGGAKVYICDSCRHVVTVPIHKTDINCLYCGKELLK